ncbi:Eukaryotic translation initiation factor SUI1 [Penicillium chermesinum]|uniref:Eukaryotic translation initiation factor SUI1 n=1 Tax=Penicillium chermesinum TaxID=63820 RepID=A0A9W9NHH5_9EURO|nr:Eukaryotic translation initiation factor SUI1 [Penicillium chermesinum]KAJ5219868.1 Eukaryotic translation initiation factor SUI1 [Penicillium chermesinum]
MSIENLKTFDPFAEAEEAGETPKTENYIHIRIQQRNGRKTLTTIQGLGDGRNHKAILKKMKADFACNGNIVNDPEMGKVIQLQGDQRKVAHEYLITKPDPEDEERQRRKEKKAKKKAAAASADPDKKEKKEKKSDDKDLDDDDLPKGLGVKPDTIKVHGF